MYPYSEVQNAPPNFSEFSRARRLLAAALHQYFYMYLFLLLYPIPSAIPYKGEFVGVLQKTQLNMGHALQELRY